MCNYLIQKANLWNQFMFVEAYFRLIKAAIISGAVLK